MHTDLLGKLISNLLSLEFVLRAFLYEHSDPPHNPLPRGLSLNVLKIGDVVPENAMTDFSSLGHLINRYNDVISRRHPNLAVDRTIVELRDALAHGRVSSTDAASDPFLLKFERPGGCKTRVTYSQQLTQEWLREQCNWVREEATKVSEAIGSPDVTGM